MDASEERFAFKFSRLEQSTILRAKVSEPKVTDTTPECTPPAGSVPAL